MHRETEKKGDLNLIALKKFAKRDDMYEIIDFLNKNLKDYHLMFGLKIEDDKMTMKIYEV